MHLEIEEKKNDLIESGFIHGPTANTNELCVFD